MAQTGHVQGSLGLRHMVLQCVRGAHKLCRRLKSRGKESRGKVHTQEGN
jgi:hypothetical protein